jgi:hypothetical protein
MTPLETLRRDLQRFRQLYQETLRQQGSPASGKQGLADLDGLLAVFAGERPFRGELLKPLSAFSNLLASGSLSQELSGSTFGDACDALGEVLAAKGASRWRFEPNVTKRVAAELGLDRAGKGLDQTQRENQSGWQRHASENGRFILSALDGAASGGTAVLVGAARAHDLPLAEIVRHFERVVIVDVCDVADTRSGIARVLSDPALLERITVERFDLTGSYGQFVADVGAVVSRAKSEAEAEREVDELVSAYDVPSHAVRLCGTEVEPDFALSSMVLTQLGLPYKAFVSRAFRARGFGPERAREGILAESLSALSCRVEQQHIAALLRIPKRAVLTSDVREGAVTLGPNAVLVPLEKPRSQLGVRCLTDRIPSRIKPLAHAAWDWLRVAPKRPGAPGSLMNVEGVALER